VTYAIVAESVDDMVEFRVELSSREDAEEGLNVVSLCPETSWSICTELIYYLREAARNTSLARGKPYPQRWRRTVRFHC
jgi:hypothetical protein